MSASDLRSTRRRAPRPPASRGPVRQDDVADAINGVRQLVRGLRLTEQHTRAATGLSAAQLFLLGQLADDRAASLGELAERTMTDRSSVAAVVERLEASGLVRTGRDAADRRRVLVQITAAGARTLADAPSAPTEILLQALQRMPAGDLRAFSASLGRLNTELGLTGAPGMLFEDRPDEGGA